MFTPRKLHLNRPFTKQDLSHISADLLYAFFVDGKFHKKEGGWLGYEAREPGSMDAAYLALSYAISDLHKPLTFEYVCKLHDFFTICITALDFYGTSCADKNGIRDGDTVITVSTFLKDMITHNGCIELLELIKKKYNKEIKIVIPETTLSVDLTGNLVGVKKLIDHELLSEMKESDSHHELADELLEAVKTAPIYYITPIKNLEDEMRKLIENFNKAVITKISAEDKIKTIIEFIYQLEHLHPFTDANLRTFGICLLSRLLLQQGYPLLILKDPNIFEGWSRDEIYLEVLKGMLRTIIVVNISKNCNGNIILFGHNSNELSQSTLDKYMHDMDLPIHLRLIFSELDPTDIMTYHRELARPFIQEINKKDEFYINNIHFSPLEFTETQIKSIEDTVAFIPSRIEEKNQKKESNIDKSIIANDKHNIGFFHAGITAGVKSISNSYLKVDDGAVEHSCLTSQLMIRNNH